MENWQNEGLGEARCKLNRDLCPKLNKQYHKPVSKQAQTSEEQSTINREL